MSSVEVSMQLFHIQRRTKKIETIVMCSNRWIHQLQLQSNRVMELSRWIETVTGIHFLQKDWLLHVRKMWSPKRLAPNGKRFQVKVYKFSRYVDISKIEDVVKNQMTSNDETLTFCSNNQKWINYWSELTQSYTDGLIDLKNHRKSQFENLEKPI